MSGLKPSVSYKADEAKVEDGTGVSMGRLSKSRSATDVDPPRPGSLSSYSRSQSFTPGLSRAGSSFIEYAIAKPPPTLEGLVTSIIAEPEVLKTDPGARRSLIAAVVGTILEFYEFSIFAYFAKEIGVNFFPGGSASLEAVKTFSVFGGGFLMRPIGSVVLGAIGDRWGTAAALRWSIALMTIPTVCTGLLPSYQKIGIWAPLLLMVTRLMQGLSVGGEFTGAILHTSDSNAAQHRGFYCAIVAVCASAGNLLGALVSTLLRLKLDKAAMVSYGWRIPFLMGSLLGFVGIFLRVNQPRHEQTDEHGHGEEPEPPLTYTELFRNIAGSDKLVLIRVMALAVMVNSFHYTNYVWLGTYMSWLAPKIMPAQDAFAVVVVMQSILIMLSPIFGHLCDKYGNRQKWVLSGVALVGVVLPLAFILLSKGNINLGFTYSFVAGIPMAFALSGNIFAYMTELIDNSPGRVTSMSLTYNLGAMVGGLYPMVASALASYKSFPVAPVLPLAGVAALVLSVFLVPPLLSSRSKPEESSKV